MVPLRKFRQRRALLATLDEARALIAPPQSETDPPASLAQFLRRETVRERLRNAEARARPIPIG